MKSKRYSANRLILTAAIVAAVVYVGYPKVVKNPQAPDVQFQDSQDKVRNAPPTTVESIDRSTHDLEETTLRLKRLAETQYAIEKRLADLEFSYINVIESELLNDGNPLNSNNPQLEVKEAIVNITEADLDTMINKAEQAYSSNHIDPQATDVVRQQLGSALEKLVNVSVDNVFCVGSVCRADFYQQDGKEIVMDTLIGLPPFDGTTVAKPGENGKVTYYFAPKDKSSGQGGSTMSGS